MSAQGAPLPGGLPLAEEKTDGASLLGDAFSRLAANKLALVGMGIVLVLFFLAAFGPYVTPYDFLAQDSAARTQPPSAAHWLGTDELGRDVLSRVVYGARTATIVAFSVTLMSFLIGVALGATAGYLGGRVDSFIVWLTDIVMSIPGLLLAVVINISLRSPVTHWMDDMYVQTQNVLFRQTFWADLVLVFGALSLIYWPTYARLIRGQVMSIRNRNYVLAARALGVRQRDIVIRYVIPNSLGPVVVAVSAGLGTAMVMESTFSFLGVGVTPPLPSWGNMISDGLRIWQNAPHLLVAPAAVLGIFTAAFSFLGDGLNDALNPRSWR